RELTRPCGDQLQGRCLHPRTIRVIRVIRGLDSWDVTAWLFLIAYMCSGLAGLVYEVTWTRLLTLYLGHTTAAASAVVSAFLGGLAIGAAIGRPLACSWGPRRCLQASIAPECAG